MGRGIVRAGFKALKLLGPSVCRSISARFWGNPRKFGDSGSIEQNATDETTVIKERGDTELSDAILGRHLTVYKWRRNSCAVD
jgi:hypothetical protein